MSECVNGETERGETKRVGRFRCGRLALGFALLWLKSRARSLSPTAVALGVACLRLRLLLF